MTEPQMLIKQMEARDIALVIKLQDACGLEGWERGWYEENLGSPNVICLSAKSDEQLLGFISTQILADELEIYLIAVSPSHRRQKIATFLLEKLHALAKAKELRAIFLEVRASNLPAQKLYQSFGFNLAGVRKGYYQNPVEDAYILRHKI